MNVTVWKKKQSQESAGLTLAFIPQWRGAGSPKSQSDDGNSRAKSFERKDHNDSRLCFLNTCRKILR